MSSVGSYMSAAWCAHGAGTMSDAHVADAVADRLVDADVGGVARAQVVTRQDDELGVGGVSEAFGERPHGPDAIAGQRAATAVTSRSTSSSVT